MLVIKKAVVKQVLTVKRKNILITDFLKQKIQLEKEIKQLEFQLYKKIKVIKNNFEHQNALKASFNKEIAERQDKIKMLEFQINQLNELKVGTEIKERTIDMLHELNVGDDWESFLNNMEIIVKDGVVAEIRAGGSVNNDKMV